MNTYNIFKNIDAYILRKIYLEIYPYEPIYIRTHVYIEIQI